VNLFLSSAPHTLKIIIEFFSTSNSAQCKALLVLYKEEFNGKPKDIMQHNALSNHHCEETCVTEDFNFSHCFER
jgi:hypothetical protein